MPHHGWDDSRRTYIITPLINEILIFLLKKKRQYEKKKRSFQALYHLQIIKEKTLNADNLQNIPFRTSNRVFTYASYKLKI
jgi:hypothetical protein